MVRSQLNSYSGSDPIWGFVALIGSERFSGEAAVGLDPRVRLFAVDGRVYFAEREGDAPISTRLVNCGAVTTTQLEHGSVRIGDVTSLARLFQREPGIDRDAVELTIENATETLLATIANKPVGLPEVFPLRHHPSGIHHWLRSAAGTHAPVVLPTAAPVAEPAVAEPVVAEPVVAEPVVNIPEPVALAPEPVINIPEPVAVVEPVVSEPVVPEPVVAEPVAESAPVWSTLARTPDPEPAAVIAPEVEVAPAAAEPAAAELAPETVVADPAPAQEEPLWQPTWQPRVPTLTSLEPEPESPAAATFDPFSEPEPAPARSLPELTPWSPAPAAETPTEQFAAIGEQAAADEPTHEQYRPAAAEPTSVTSTFAPLPMLGSLNGTSHDATPEAAQPVADEPAAAPTLSAMPTLGSLTPLGSVNGHQVEESASPAAHAPSAADLLGSLDSLTSAPAAPVATAAPEVNPYEPSGLPAGLPKLASAPVSVDALRDLPASDPAGPWSGPAHSHAAMGIWEMVDELLDDGKPAEQDLVASGGNEKRGRGWLRGKKG